MRHRIDEFKLPPERMADEVVRVLIAKRDVLDLLRDKLPDADT
jgi:hypothetical protein